MSQNISSPSFIKKSVINGLSGSFAVSIQTISLMWIHTIMEESKKTGVKLTSSVYKLYHQGGIFRFYKGFMPAFRSAALARFGDNSTNTFVMSHFQQRKNLKNISIAVQSALIWIIASTWRLAIMPFDALDLKSRKEMFQLNLRVIGNFRKNIKRLYLKRTRPQILSLYFWFCTQNYLLYYIPAVDFKDSFKLAFLRYGFIGFCSMICFDLFLAAVRKIRNINPIQHNYGVLLGESGKTLLKGCHGIVFCASSNYIREKYKTLRQ